MSESSNVIRVLLWNSSLKVFLFVVCIRGLLSIFGSKSRNNSLGGCVVQYERAKLELMTIVLASFVVLVNVCCSCFETCLFLDEPYGNWDVVV